MNKKHLSIFSIALFFVLTVIFSPSAQTAQAAAPTSGLVAYWKFEGNANDSQGSNNGTLVGGPTFTTGKVGQALNFGGPSTSQYVSYPSLAFSATSPRTVSAWFKLNVDGFNEPAWDSQPIVTTDYFYIYVPLSINNIRTRTADAASAYMTSYTLGSGDRAWHHVVGTYSFSGGIQTQQIYIDGVLKNQLTFAVIPATTYLSTLGIGRGNGGYFNGLIDEVRVYNRVLSSSEVQSIYIEENSGSPTPTPTPTPTQIPTSTPTPTPTSTNATLYFHSGFEADTVQNQWGVSAPLRGIDKSVSAPNDWFNDLDGRSDVVGFFPTYVCDDTGNREASIINDPTGRINPKTGQINKVWYWWLKDTVYCGAESRVSTLTYFEPALKHTEGFQRVRMYFHPDFQILKQYPTDVAGWAQFEEFWIRQLGTGYVDPFRITFHLGVDKGTNQFYWNVESNQCCNGYPSIEFWNYKNKTVPVPFGEWFTAETYYKAGNNNTGRLVFSIQREGQAKQTVFDITNWTYHPNHPLEGLYSWASMKLYYAPSFVDFVTNNGGLLQMYWDDWEWWSSNPNTTPTPTPIPTPTPTPTTLAGDLNGDRVINSIDFSIMNGAWLTNNATSDLNKDGIVNSLDFSIMNGNWLKTY